jgi:hypothetical protein
LDIAERFAATQTEQQNAADREIGAVTFTDFSTLTSDSQPDPHTARPLPEA